MLNSEHMLVFKGSPCRPILEICSLQPRRHCWWIVPSYGNIFELPEGRLFSSNVHPIQEKWFKCWLDFQKATQNNQFFYFIFLLHFYIGPMIGELGRDGKHMNFVKVFHTTNLARKIWRRRGVGGWWSNLRKCQCRNECLESRYWNIGLVQSSHTRAASRQSSPGKRRPIRPEYLPENEEK